MKEILTETTLSREEIFKGRIFDVNRDKVSLPDGKVSTREVVIHKTGGACVVALTEEGKVWMVRQYRYPYGEVVAEVPAGKLDPGETPEECARRELAEEVGATAERFTCLGEFYPSPGYVCEVVTLFLAEGLHYQGQHLDEGEFLEAEAIPLAELVEEVLKGGIKDGKTQAALLKAALLLEKRR